MIHRPISYAAGVGFVAAGAICWSFGGALVRFADGVDVWQIMFYRSIVVLICMTVWLGHRFGAALPGRIINAGVNAVIAGICVAVAGLTFVAALYYTTVAQAIFMVGIAPFLSAMLGYWILRERIPRVTWIAMVVALAGMAAIFVGMGSGAAFVGTMLSLYSAFCFSCYAVLLRWGQKSEMSVALIWNALFLIAVSSVILLLPTGLREETGTSQLAVGWRNLATIVIMGAVQLTLGLILFTVGSRSVPAAQLSLIGLIEPTLSPLWAWLVSGELPPLSTFAGGAVILSAIVILALFSARGEGRHARRRTA